ncbi:MAG: hypothetical protein AAGG51_02875 [Cyanobacteria bacterium P01_G01_bin.54]
MVFTDSQLDLFSSCYQSFSIDSISQAPEASGIYAWYATLDAGRMDWELDVVDGVDAGIERLRKLLRKQTNRYNSLELNTIAKGAFSQTWGGSLTDKTSDVLLKVLGDNLISKSHDSHDEKKAPKLQDTLESRDARKLMVSALQGAIPIFSSPIYIGVAECLRRRLLSHANDITKISMEISRDPDARDGLKKYRNKSFATRVISTGFNPSHLKVFTFDFDELNRNIEINSVDTRTVAESVEWLLNRWYHPYLGKR